MKQISLKIKKGRKEDYYLNVLTIAAMQKGISQSLPNLETLSKFMALPKENYYLPFNVKARKVVAASYPYKFSSALMTTRLKRLEEAGYITRDEDNFQDFAPWVRQIRDSVSFTLNVSYDTTLDNEDGRTSQSTTQSSGEGGDVAI